MKKTRQIEIFSAGCQICEDTVNLVKQLACPSCEVTVLDMKNHIVAQRAGSLGIRTVPTVVVDGRLAECCAEGGPSEQVLRAAGIGTPVS
ncbi:MAG: thioredoxin family protein [Nitrospirales bacterium]|nr:thioredoxin family protein [Nitrospirales bacterium]